MLPDPAPLLRRHVFPCALLLLAAACSGCPKQNADQPETVERPFASQRVPIRAPEELDLESRARLVLNEWSTRTGAEWNVEELRTTPDERLPRPGGLRGGARLILFPIAQTAELAHAGWLAAIPEPQRERSGFDWLDVIAGLRENVCTVGGQPSLIPLSSPVLVCYYRRDLLEAAGLSPPETWEEYQELVESLDGWAGGLSAVEPWGEEYRATMFLARAVGFAKHPGQLSLFFRVGDSEPLIDSPGFVRGLEAARAALDRMPAAVDGFSPADCRREVLEGRAALAVAFETGPDAGPLLFGPAGAPNPAPVTDPASASDPAAVSDGERGGSATRRPEEMEIGFCRLPGASQVFNPSTAAWEPASGGDNRVTLTAFAGLAAGVAGIDASPDRRGEQAAWNLLHVLTVDEAATVFPADTLSLCRHSQAAQPDRWAGRDLAPGEARAFAESVVESLRDGRLVAEIPVVGRDRFRRALTDGLEPVLSGAMGAEAALQAVAEEWRRIASDVGIDAVRDSYRRSLGLSVRTRPAPIVGASSGG